MIFGPHVILPYEVSSTHLGQDKRIIESGFKIINCIVCKFI